MKQFPELLPKGPAKFVPKIYGFKIFGMRGSKYELKFDYQGKPINEDEIRQVLRRGQPNSGETAGSISVIAAASNAVSNPVGQGSASMNIIS